MRGIQRFLVGLIVLITTVGCCTSRYDAGEINTPDQLKLVENAVEAEFYDAELATSLLSQSVLELPSCGGFDGLDVQTLVSIGYRGSGCGAGRYGAFWNSEGGVVYWEWLNEAGSYNESREDVCSRLSSEYRCMPFEYSSHYIPSGFESETQDPWEDPLPSWEEPEPQDPWETSPVEPEHNQTHTVELRVYSRYKFADDSDYGDDFRRHPEAFEQGEEGSAPVAIVVRTFETTDPDAFDLPWRIQADPDGRYRCADAFYGHFVR